MKFLERADKWHESHTNLSKYLVTRLYQLVDVYEVISYRYPVTNGMILIEEIYDTATACLERAKGKERLKSLLEESYNKDISTSVVNDPIIVDYFRQIVSYFNSLSKQDTLQEDDIKSIQIQTLIFLSLLQNKYIYFLFDTLKQIDFCSTHFDILPSQSKNRQRD